MCGRLACTLEKDDIIKACKYKDKNDKLTNPQWIPSCFDYHPFYNGPPTTSVAVLADKKHFSGCETDICVVSMRWGMMPSHIPDTGLKALHTHNARYETILQSPLYKPCLANGRRCVILAEGYYEWKTTPGENNKQPYYLYQEPNKSINKSEDDKNIHLIKFAGIFNKTVDNGKTKYSCTIITKESDNTMSWMHHRMPIILNTEEEVENWLNYEKLKDVDAVKSLLSIESQKNPTFEVKYHPVDKAYVNKSTFDDKKCMEKISLKRKSTFLTSWLDVKKPKKDEENL